MNFPSSQKNRTNECYTENEFYSLYKIIGFGSKNNFSIAKNELNGLIAWISGPYVIFYDILSDSQVFFLKNINNKIISCIQFSSNGKLFATGEGNCKNGDICLYDIFYNGKKHNYNLLLSYQAHKYGINKLFFFKNDKFLLSIGNKEDKLMNIMDIENKQIIYSYIFNKNILGVDICNDFAVISGNNFIKIYEFNFNKLNSNSNSQSNDLLVKKPVELSKLKDKCFVYASIYINNIINEQKVFFITEDCYLVELMTSKLMVTRWINLKANKGYNLTIWDNKIGCGCSDGIYRIFNVDNLSHIQNLHKPPPLCPDFNNNNVNSQKSSNLIYPDVMCNLYSKFHKKLILVYSNKYFLIWNMNQMNIVRYHIFQSGSIKNMDSVYDNQEKILKIATCSDDKTVIFWNFRLNEDNINPLYDSKIQHITYSKYIRHIFYFSKNYEQFKLKNEDGEIENNDLNEGEDGINLTSVKFSADNQYLYIGDSIGNLHIYSLSNNFEEIIEIPAHNDRINSIDTIAINNDDNLDNNSSNKNYIATGSSDNYVNIFDISNGFKSNLNINDFNTIFEKMSSEVINLVFCIDKNKKIKLIVSESNSSISFFQLINNSLQILQKHNEKSLKTYCLCNSPSIKKIISGHNGKIIIWKTSSNIIHKHFQVSKGDKLLDNFRIAADSNGVIFATSNNDKNIRIRALHDGKLLCKISVAESISNLSFVLNDNYLLATSVEGYIYIYKINQNFISKLKRDKELINSMEEKTVINNKLNLLQKLLENDVSLSKNEQVNDLIEKFRKSEETSIGDLKKLDEFLIENKKRGIKNEEIIQLKEDKPNNNDDQDNQNNNDNDSNNNKNREVLSKSNLFEFGLKGNKNGISKNKSNKIFFQNRVSIIDKYIKKENKKKDNSNKIKKINFGDLDLNNINNFRKAKSPREINNKREKSPKNTINSPRANPFDKNTIKTDYKNIISNSMINNKINFNKNNKKAKENNISNNSDTFETNMIFHKKGKIYDLKDNKNYNNNSRPNALNKKKIKNNEINLDNKYNSYSLENKNIFIVSKGNRFSINKKYKKKKIDYIIKKENSFILKNRFNNRKKMLIQGINNINIEQINKKDDLEKLENNLELLRNKIRKKLGIDIKDTKKEKLLDQFGVLLIDRINQLQKNK